MTFNLVVLTALFLFLNRPRKLLVVEIVEIIGMWPKASRGEPHIPNNRLPRNQVLYWRVAPH